MINKYFPILDHGFVSLKDIMGNDVSIEEAARVSYGAGTRKKSTTRGLIRYLMRHKHTTPFEMVEFKFHICAPLFVARQWMRHRTASINEYSGRYSIIPTMFYCPNRENLTKQSEENNQGRDESLISEENYKRLTNVARTLRSSNKFLYKSLLEQDVARELARIDLPLSTYTIWYWKVNLHNLFHFLKLRCDEHSQWEIRQYSDTIAGIVKEACPLAFEAWLDYGYNASNLTALDKKLINTMRASPEQVEKLAAEIGMSKREIKEFYDKITLPSIKDFSLDPSLAKSGEYFEQKIEEYTICPQKK